MTQSPDVGRGGARANSGGPRVGSGRPRGSRTKVYKPHAEKLLAAQAGGLTPKEISVFVARWHFKAKRYDEAARVASLAAPYYHPKLQATAMTVRPRLSELSADELRTLIDEAREDLGLADDEDFASVKAKGTAWRTDCFATY